ncbi:MAG: energy-coupling factor ABC transporter ATP-binding protein [Alphaproteobacteria bacterium]|nr:energy-coupling factor ABC transporter ATP-binding protein [Alphaproteobacteria bacterium]MBU0803912.1 energy-coupling factor ABC transporter ATP-binding protein [Alphaproteobacteria bacterium]MBU0872791.1 energy-coupling factor ABC transporter ATP-binding protein [Alphaproteobacteria bacterium]MBU1402839.1 energy-coupling factor ABC transporter ATP-binding protein [Alphaproteobacteria bacterium]MBU1593481.1 energy-coupling factor ABC transporter ATP-binding protein [Alphaproteobacteria bact
MLKVEGVGFHYVAGTEVLRDLSFSASAGDIVALVGRNGAGKSTLLRLLNGLLKPTRGTVTIDGNVTAETPVHLISRSIGTVFQSPEQQIFNATVRDEVMFGPRNLPITAEERETRVREALERTRLTDQSAVHPLDLDQAKRRFVALASVLATRPPALLLDEPQRGLDARGRLLLERIVLEEQAKGCCVVIVCHDMEFVARLATRVIALSDGEISADRPPAEFFLDAKLTAGASVEAPDILRVSQQLGLPPCLTPAAFAEAWVARSSEPANRT